MLKCEQETVIVFNKQDMEEGYVLVSTSLKGVYEQFKKKTEIIDLKVSKYKGNEEEWIFKIPVKGCRKPYGICKKVREKRVLSEEQKTKLREQLASRNKKP